MQKIRTMSLMRLSVVALFLAALLPGPVILAAQDAATSYTDQTHNVTLEWTADWVGEADDTRLPGFTTIFLEKNYAFQVTVAVTDANNLPADEAVWLLYEEGSEIIEDSSESDPPRVRYMQADGMIMDTVEAYTLNDGATTVLVIVMTIPTLMDAALESVQAEITVNGSPVMTGEPLDDNGVATDLTTEATAVGAEDPTEEATEESGRTSRTTRGSGEATAEATEESSRTSRTTRGSGEATAEATEESGQSGRTSRTTRGTGETPDVTEEATSETSDTPIRTTRSSGEESPEATEEATEESGRTSRSTRGTDETPEVTEVSTEEPTEKVTESLGMDTYVGPIYGHSFEYNPNIWTGVNEFDGDAMEGIRLDSESASVVLWAHAEYGADPVACLDGESEYFGTSADYITDWELAVDDDGQPLRADGDELAWGVFTYTYTSEDGTEVTFVDYLSCETIPGQDAVLIVQMTSVPDAYNDNLDLVLDILDTLEFQP